MKFLVILTLILLFTGFISLAQTGAISGTVRDEKHLVLPGATVFLNGTQLATACNEYGQFHLYNVPAGSYEIVIKMIGYNAFVKSVTVTSAALIVNANLEPNSVALNEVKIHPDYDREKHLAIFKEQFLGQTYNAKACKILNADVIYFTYDKKSKILNATADEFLIIKNDALGYKLKYLLADFKLNENTNVVTYQGYPSFEALKGTPKQEEQWAKNRKIAYSGSINHFIKSLYENRSLQEGFNVYKIVDRPMMSKTQGGKLISQLVDFDSLLTRPKADLRSLSFKDCLYVVYDKEKEPDEYQQFGFTVNDASAHIPEGQVSLVYLLADKIELDDRGLYTPAEGLFFEGYWAWEKVADLMPIEYNLSGK